MVRNYLNILRVCGSPQRFPSWSNQEIVYAVSEQMLSDQKDMIEVTPLYSATIRTSAKVKGAAIKTYLKI